MKHPIVILSILLATVLCSCKKNESINHESTHEDVIDEFQSSQLKFKNLVKGIRDTKSYDLASQKLDQIVDEFEKVANDLSQLNPPDEELRQLIAMKIERGNKLAEPTGEDMISLLSIKDRDKEVQNWIKEFTVSGQKVGKELTRLYLKNKAANKSQ